MSNPDPPERWFGFVSAPSQTWIDNNAAILDGYCPFCTPTVQLTGEFFGTESQALQHFSNIAGLDQHVWVGFAG